MCRLSSSHRSFRPACPRTWRPFRKDHAPTELFRTMLDGRHVLVRQPEMMTDLVHQHMLDDGAERFVVLGPVIDDRAAIEPDHVGHLYRRAVGAERQANALEQAEQIELALGPHLIEHLIAWEIVDLDDKVRAQIAKFPWQMAKYF